MVLKINCMWGSSLGTKHYFVEDNVKSNSKLDNQGVPKGSTVGPVLFHLNINNTIKTDDCKHFSFADDPFLTWEAHVCLSKT